MTEEVSNPYDPSTWPTNACGLCAYWNPNQGFPIERTEDKICHHPKQTLAYTDDFMACNVDGFSGKYSTDVNVPNHIREASMTDPNPNKLDGPTEILIISHAKDFEWLVYALRCLKKYFTGQQGITVAHPNKDKAQFLTLLDQFDVRLYGYNEVPGKGHIQHMEVMASADLFMPHGTKYMLTTDSDGMFKMASTPEHYAWNDKPYWIARSWESLTTEDPHNPGTKVVSDNLQWQPVTEAQLGFPPELFTMCMNIQLIPLDLLKHYRTHIEKTHHKSFHDYMVEGRNEFPPTRVDFNALGAFFYKFHRDRFHWFRVENPPYPVDRKKSYWSWGGITPEIRSEMDGFLNAYVPNEEELSRMAQ